LKWSWNQGLSWSLVHTRVLYPLVCILTKGLVTFCFHDSRKARLLYHAHHYKTTIYNQYINIFRQAMFISLWPFDADSARNFAKCVEPRLVMDFPNAGLES
jgi:hypothetical protein